MNWKALPDVQFFPLAFLITPTTLMPYQDAQLKIPWTSHSFLMKSSFHVGFGPGTFCTPIFG